MSFGQSFHDCLRQNSTFFSKDQTDDDFLSAHRFPALHLGMRHTPKLEIFKTQKATTKNETFPPRYNVRGQKQTQFLSDASLSDACALSAKVNVPATARTLDFSSPKATAWISPYQLIAPIIGGMIPAPGFLTCAAVTRSAVAAWVLAPRASFFPVTLQDISAHARGAVVSALQVQCFKRCAHFFRILDAGRVLKRADVT